MSNPGLPELLAKIEQASAECREVIQATHEATRDLKTLLREAREVITEIEQAAHRSVEERVGEAVVAGLEEYKGTIRRQIDAASQKVIASFEDLSNTLRYGNPQGRGRDVVADAIDLKRRRDAENGDGS